MSCDMRNTLEACFAACLLLQIDTSRRSGFLMFSTARVQSLVRLPATWNVLLRGKHNADNAWDSFESATLAFG